MMVSAQEIASLLVVVVVANIMFEEIQGMESAD